MRMRFAITARALLVPGCEGMKEKVHDSRQERCARADGKEVGRREGLARRPRPPV